MGQTESLNLNFEDRRQDVTWNGLTGESDAWWGKQGLVLFLGLS